MPTPAQADPKTVVTCPSCEGLGCFPDWGITFDQCRACKGTGKLTKDRLDELVKIEFNATKRK